MFPFVSTKYRFFKPWKAINGKQNTTKCHFLCKWASRIASLNRLSCACITKCRREQTFRVLPNLSVASLISKHKNALCLYWQVSQRRIYLENRSVREKSATFRGTNWDNEKSIDWRIRRNLIMKGRSDLSKRKREIDLNQRQLNKQISAVSRRKLNNRNETKAT